MYEGIHSVPILFSSLFSSSAMHRANTVGDFHSFQYLILYLSSFTLYPFFRQKKAPNERGLYSLILAYLTFINSTARYCYDELALLE